MKISTINGSPRKNGCSAVLLAKIAEGAKRKGWEAESFQPNTMKVLGCQACMKCKQDNRCVITDDMAKLYKAIDESDVVVFGVPLYFHEMSSQTKTVVDRLYPYVNMDSNFNFSSSMKKDKRCIVVMPYGNIDQNFYNEYAKSLEDKFKFLGFDSVEVFIASDSMSNHPEYLEQCYNLGLSL